MTNKNGTAPERTAPQTLENDTAEQVVKQLETAMQVFINAMLTELAVTVVVVGSVVTL